LRALKLKNQFTMPQAAGKKTQPDNAVTDNHDCGKDSVAC
jgi:hypothetical protein